MSCINSAHLIIRSVVAVFLLLTGLMLSGAVEPFQLRGYYITFMRMPVMGLPEWKDAVDCFVEDDANVLILWMGGGFRSKKFPITWQYNEEHANVRQDFARELIDYAHRKNIRVLLGFTPFGYDGVNRYGIDHPELKARKKDGSPVEEFGIHSRGWNLCAAKEESQRFMREYVSEMVFDFYPNADGLLVESSDYGICHCAECGAKYYDREFQFVRWLSDEVWKRNTNALILVYPHYFTGKKVPGLDAVAAKQPFDARWGLSFSPHSSHFDSNLISRAKTSVYWTDAPVLGTPQGVAKAARAARAHGVNGFIPSLEAFSYIAQGPDGGEPWVVGKRMKPFGLNALGEGKMPYRFLIPSIQRFAVREFSHDPELKFNEFKRRLGEHFFGKDGTSQKLDDLLELQRIWTHGSDWYWSSPLLDPAFFAQRAKRLKWSPEKLAEYEKDLAILRGLSGQQTAPVEIRRLATDVVRRWGTNSPMALRQD
jgi:hypothetical protein